MSVNNVKKCIVIVFRLFQPLWGGGGRGGQRGFSMMAFTFLRFVFFSVFFVLFVLVCVGGGSVCVSVSVFGVLRLCWGERGEVTGVLFCILYILL